MAEEFNGYSISLTVEDGSETLPRKSLAFVKHDSIFSVFPTLEIIFPDLSGIAMEYGTFLQGVKLVSTIGEEGTGNLLTTNWKVFSRDSIKAAGSEPRLSGVLKVQAVHESFFENRESPNLAFSKKLVSDCFKELFPSKTLAVEDTVGKVSTFAFDEPFKEAEKLKELAGNGQVSPFVFFINLNNEFVFYSVKTLMEETPVASFELKPIFSDLDDALTTIQGFLPITEDARKVFEISKKTQFSVDSELSQEGKEFSISDSEANSIPLLTEDLSIYSYNNFGRQFNPDVDYEQLNSAIASNSMKFILDKAVCIVPFNYLCVAGKVVEIKINVLDFEGAEKLSEYFSGNWLIEQSYHTWDGSSMRPSSKLILCRTGVKPVKNSILSDKSLRV